MKHLTTLAAVAALGLPMTQAHAASASVHVTQLNFTVIDLLPNDGLAPAFAFLANDHFITKASSNGPHEFFQEKSTPGLLSNLTFDPTSSISQGHVAITKTSLDVSTSVTSDVDYNLSLSGSTGLDIYGYDSMIWVAPGTGLVVSATVDLAADATCSANALNCYSTANFSMTLNDKSVTKYVSAGQFANGPDTYSGFAGLVYTNFNSYAQNIQFSASGQNYLVMNTAVPEPASHALLLAGGLVAIGLNRRRPRA